MLAAEPVRAFMQRARGADARSLVRAASNAGGLAAILAVVFLAYSRILGQWFVSDDFWFLRASQAASLDFAQQSFDYTQTGPVPEFVYRPLYPIAFLFTYKLFGLTAWQYHLFSIAVHMVNTVLVFLVARKLIGRASVAYLAAFIFGLHPAYAPAVAWITSNVGVFAMVFSLGSVLLFLNFLDGGPRRWLYYGASFLGVIIAILIHPESAGTFAVMVIAQLLWRARSISDLRSPRLYLPVVPHVVVAVVFFCLLQYIRDHNPYQQQAFALGRHMFHNYLAYVAHLGNPFGVPEVTATNWRIAVPVLGAGVSGLYLLFSKSFDYRSRLLVLAWFGLAVLPLTTFTLGIQSRKLYAAGAPFALMMAMAAVAAWDRLALRLRPFDPRALDLRYAAVAAGLLLVAVALPLRTWQVTDERHMAHASLTDLDSQTYKAMIEQIRETYPTLPEGARLDLAGVPWTLLIFGILDTRMSDAVEIYYGERWVIGVGDPAHLPPPIGPNRYLVQFVCPPICAPPLPAAWIAAIQEATGQESTVP